MKSAGLPTTKIGKPSSFCTEKRTLETDGDKNKKRPNTFSFPGVPLVYKGYCNNALKNVLISTALIGVG